MKIICEELCYVHAGLFEVFWWLLYTSGRGRARRALVCCKQWNQCVRLWYVDEVSFLRVVLLLSMHLRVYF